MAGIARPCLAERGARQCGRHATFQKPANVGVDGNRLDRWQARRIKGFADLVLLMYEWRFRAAEATASSCDPLPVGSVFALGIGLAFQSRPNVRRSFRAQSFIAFRFVFASSQRRLRRLASAFDEGPLDVVFGEKLNDGFYDFGGHWHRFDQIAAGIGESSPSAGSAVTARISYGCSEAAGCKATHSAGAHDERLSR